MSSLLLLTVPAWGVEMPPLGAALIKASLQAEGLDCECRDFNQKAWQYLKGKNQGDLWDKDNLHLWSDSKRFHTQILPLLQGLADEWVEWILAHPAPVVGFSLWDSNIHMANTLMERIHHRDPDRILLAGGPQMTFKEMRVKLSPACTHYLVGEAEGVLSRYLRGRSQGQPLPEGFYSVQEELHRDLSYRQMQTLHDQPTPDFSDFPSQYSTRAIPVLMTRSCLFQCRFCSDFKSMGAFRKLKATAMERVFRQIYARGYRELWFNDLLINGIIEELADTLDRLAEDRLFFEFIALATPNAQLKSTTLKRLAQRGLKTLNHGLESGSGKIMRAMKKGFNPVQAKQALQRIHEAGICNQINMIVGFPGETEEDFEESLQFLEQNRHSIHGFTSVNTCILLPGSEIHSRREELGLQMPPEHPHLWEMPGNTPAIRNSRLKRLKKWIHSNGYSIYTSNLHS